MKRLFVDMDGTLAEWKQVEAFEELYEEGHFLNLEPHDNVLEVVEEIRENEIDVEVFILSAYLTDSPFALYEKNQWLDQHTEIDIEHRIFVPYGLPKALYIPGTIKETDFLLDDFTENLFEWENSGGHGIKLLNGINHTNKTWVGSKLNYEDTSISKQLDTIISSPTRVDYLDVYENAKEQLNTEQTRLEDLMDSSLFLSKHEGEILYQQKVVDQAIKKEAIAKEKICLRYGIDNDNEFERFVEKTKHMHDKQVALSYIGYSNIPDYDESAIDENGVSMQYEGTLYLGKDKFVIYFGDDDNYHLKDSQTNCITKIERGSELFLTTVLNERYTDEYSYAQYFALDMTEHEMIEDLQNQNYQPSIVLDGMILENVSIQDQSVINTFEVEQEEEMEL